MQKLKDKLTLTSFHFAACLNNAHRQTLQMWVFRKHRKKTLKIITVKPTLLPFNTSYTKDSDSTQHPVYYSAFLLLFSNSIHKHIVC